MNLSYAITSHVDDFGKLTRNRKLLAETLLKFKGKDIEIIIEKKRKKRSIRQNRLLWLYSTIIANDTGNSKELIHEVIKYKFLQKEKIDEITGEIFKYVGSTTELTTTDFAGFIEEIIRWAGETFSISLPLPNEQLEINVA